MAYPTIVERFGSLSATGIAKETTFGTPVAATTFLPMTGNGMEFDPGWFSPELMIATRDAQVFNLYGEAKNAGGIEGALMPSNAMALIVASIGTDVVTGTAAPYTHTVSQANTLASLTIEKNLGNFQSLQFAGSRVSKLSIKAPVGNAPVSVSADMEAQSVAILTSPTAVSITNELPFVFSEASLTLASNVRADVTNVQLDIDNGLKGTYTFSGAGNNGPAFLSPVKLHVSGTIDVVWSSLNNGTYGDFTTLKNGTLGTLALGFAHPSGFGITLNCPQVALAKYANDIKFDDVIMSSLTFEASKPLTGGSQYTIGAVITNAVSIAY